MEGELSGEKKIDVLLHEYDALVGENRRCMSQNAQLLAVGIGAATALVGAGIWTKFPQFFLVMPFLVVFVLLICVIQLHEVVLIGAQLAVLERRIKDIAGEQLLSFFSHTVPMTCDTTDVHLRQTDLASTYISAHN